MRSWHLLNPAVISFIAEFIKQFDWSRGSSAQIRFGLGAATPRVGLINMPGKRKVAVPSGCVVSFGYVLILLVGLCAFETGAQAQVSPSITLPPQSQTVIVGTNVTFGVTATGTAPLSYQWRKDGVNLSDGGRQQSFALASARSTPLTGDKAIEHLKATGQYESLAAAITAARYAVKPVEDGSANPHSAIRSPQSSPLWAQNPAHGLNCTFSPAGLTFTVRSSAGFQPAVSPVSNRQGGATISASECTDTPQAGSPAIQHSAATPQPKERRQPCPRVQHRREPGADKAVRAPRIGAAQIPCPPGELKVSGQRVELTRGSALPIPHSELRVPHLGCVKK